VEFGIGVSTQKTIEFVTDGDEGEACTERLMEILLA